MVDSLIVVSKPAPAVKRGKWVNNCYADVMRTPLFLYVYFKVLTETVFGNENAENDNMERCHSTLLQMLVYSNWRKNTTDIVFIICCCYMNVWTDVITSSSICHWVLLSTAFVDAQQSNYRLVHEKRRWVCSSASKSPISMLRVLHSPFLGMDWGSASQQRHGNGLPSTTGITLTLSAVLIAILR